MTLNAENISKKFGQNGLAPVSMSIAENQFHVVIGESGCGKTTLLNILTGMLSPDSGSVTIDGKNIFTDMKESERTLLRYEKISYMTQGSTLIPELTVWQNIICPLELSGRKADEKDVNELAQKLGIVNILDSFPSEISGGEYRRVLLARCILPDAKLLLVDEPTSSLDKESAAIVREILFEEYKKGKGLLIVTHDRELLSYQPQIHELQAMKG